MIVAATSYCPHAFGLTYVDSNPAVYRTLCSQAEVRQAYAPHTCSLWSSSRRWINGDAAFRQGQR